MAKRWTSLLWGLRTTQGQVPRMWGRVGRHWTSSSKGVMCFPRSIHRRLLQNSLLWILAILVSEEGMVNLTGSGWIPEFQAMRLKKNSAQHLGLEVDAVVWGTQHPFSLSLAIMSVFLWATTVSYFQPLKFRWGWLYSSVLDVATSKQIPRTSASITKTSSLPPLKPSKDMWARWWGHKPQGKVQESCVSSGWA